MKRNPAGKVQHHTEVGSVVLEWRSLTPCTFPHVPTEVQQKKCSGSSCLVKGTWESGKENGLAQKKWALLVCLSWPEPSHSGRSAWSWSPHENVADGSQERKKVWIVHMGALPRELILWTRTVHWPKQWWGWPVSDVRGKGPFPAQCFLWL